MIRAYLAKEKVFIVCPVTKCCTLNNNVDFALLSENLVNLASGGQAFQSSTFRSEEGITFPAGVAIDGSQNNSILGNSCSQTSKCQPCSRLF